MLVASLLDLGADGGKIRKKLADVAGIRIKKVKKRGVSAVRFDVSYPHKKREYPQLVEDVRKLRLPKKVEALSLRILKTLATAESHAHNVPLTKVHLHEAADSMVDAVAFSMALHDLKQSDSPINASILSVGKLAPATEHILRRHSIPHKIISEKEIATPTGAAILANAASEYGDTTPSGKVGCGAGAMNMPYPNVVRAVLGSRMYLLESNIDDATPEDLSYVSEKLFEEGALDVHLIPCVMKKGRLGHLVRILTSKPYKLSNILMKESGTLGVRMFSVEKRFEAERELLSKKIKLSGRAETVRVKKSQYTSKPEFEDLKKIARKHRIPIKSVRERI